MVSTDLAEWERTRTPLFRLKDRVMAADRRRAQQERRIDAMAGLLKTALQVGANDEGTVSFVLRWPDPVMGRQLVDSAMQTFEQRRVTEAAAITDSIAILDRSANAIESETGRPSSALPAPGRAPRRPCRGRPRAGRRPTTSGWPACARRSPSASRKWRASKASTRSSFGEAQARLSAALTIHTEGHPTVVSLKQTVARLAVEPPEPGAARGEAGALEAQHDRASIPVGALTARAEQDRLLSQPRRPPRRSRAAAPVDRRG
ncbi:MAG: hypothetical protein R2708_25255 [Vicinamibacterales bacterium]